MALRFFNGSSYDNFVGAVAIGAASATFTTTFTAGVARTAPNTIRKATGVLFYLNATPGLGDIEIELRESGVSKASAVALNADCQPGNANGSWFIERRTLGSYLWENVAGGSGYASAWADREILVYV